MKSELFNVLENLMKTLGERLREHDSEIEELKKRIKWLEQEPRQTLKQKLRARREQ